MFFKLKQFCCNILFSLILQCFFLFCEIITFFQPKSVKLSRFPKISNKKSFSNFFRNFRSCLVIITYGQRWPFPSSFLCGPFAGNSWEFRGNYLLGATKRYGFTNSKTWIRCPRVSCPSCS